MRYILVILLLNLMIIPAALAQMSTAPASLVGRVTIYDADFGDFHTVEETFIVAFPEDEIPYDYFQGQPPSGFNAMTEGRFVEDKQAGYAHILPPSGYFKIENLMAGSYWVCNFFLDEAQQQSKGGLFRRFPDAMYLWGCQNVILNPGQNKQDFHWNANGFWIHE